MGLSEKYQSCMYGRSESAIRSDFGINESDRSSTGSFRSYICHQNSISGSQEHPLPDQFP